MRINQVISLLEVGGGRWCVVVMKSLLLFNDKSELGGSKSGDRKGKKGKGRGRDVCITRLARCWWLWWLWL